MLAATNTILMETCTSCSVLFLTILLSGNHVSGAGVSINNYTVDSPLVLNTHRSLSLRCTAEGNTADEELVWYRNDELIDLKEGNKINRSEVCITSVSPSDNEVPFTCLLKSNSSAKVTVVLDVQYPPDLSGENLAVVGEGSNVDLTCYVKGNPQANVAWRQANGTLVLKKGRYSLSRTSEMIRLSISKVEKSDSAIYICEASNDQNMTTREFYLVVEDRYAVLPLEAIIAAVVVVVLTLLFGVVARREKIWKRFKKPSSTAL